MSHIVNSCPLTKYDGSLLRLYEVHEAAVDWQGTTDVFRKGQVGKSAFKQLTHICYNSVLICEDAYIPYFSYYQMHHTISRTALFIAKFVEKSLHKPHWSISSTYRA